MPSGATKVLDFNQYKKSDKAVFYIHTDLECLIENINGCKDTDVEAAWKLTRTYSGDN